MTFADDVECALRAAVELVNSAEEPAGLTTVAELSELFERYGYTGRHERTRAELAAVQELRGELPAGAKAA